MKFQDGFPAELYTLNVSVPA